MDSNGLTMVERKLDWREGFELEESMKGTVEGNFHPMTSLSIAQNEGTILSR